MTYVFHGRTANDWVFDGHRYTALFVVAPNDSQRSQIATVVERLLARGPVESGAAWTWTDRWASFTVGERWRAGDAFFARMAEVFDAIHAIAPLTQVRHANVGLALGLVEAPADGWQPDAVPAVLIGVGLPMAMIGIPLTLEGR